ncbi:hypothetical protein ACRYI5_01325 [Furfurilactobacillus sp. WILCCON 0119]
MIYFFYNDDFLLTDSRPITEEQFTQLSDYEKTHCTTVLISPETPDQQGFDGLRPQFDPDKQTWHPYKEPVVPDVKDQALNQLGLQVAKLMAEVQHND